MIIRRLALVLLSVTPLLFSCSGKNSAGGRVKVTTADGAVVAKTVYIPLEGESSSLDIRAEKDVEIFYNEAPGAYGEWFSISDIRKNGTGSYTVSYTAKPRGNTLDLRSGTLSIVSPEDYLGAFISIRQGYRKIWEKSFGNDGMAIYPGAGWTSPTMDGISSIKDAWLSFSAKADVIPGTNGLFPLTVTLVGGATFHDIDRTVYELDVQSGDTFGSDSFYKLHIMNGGRVFSSESAVKFSVPSELSSVIRIGNVSIYEIPVESDGITGISQSDE